MTWREILKGKGLTDEQIKQIETAGGPAIGEFDAMIQAAETKNQEAQRLVAEADKKKSDLNKWWNEDATKQINEAFSKATTAEAQAEFYKKQAESAKANGFIPADAPGYTPPAAPKKEGEPGFVPGANPVPGSPGAPRYMTQDQAISALTNTFFISNEHQRLFGQPLPGEELQNLMQEASSQGGKVVEIWERKYKVGEKRSEIAAKAQKDHDDAIRTETETRVKREFAERYGNSETRPMVPSRFPKYVQDGAKDGKMDKLAWARPGAKENFRQKMHEQVAKETTRVN